METEVCLWELLKGYGVVHIQRRKIGGREVFAKSLRLSTRGRDIPNVYVVFFKVFHRRAILADPREVANNISLTIATNKQKRH